MYFKPSLAENKGENESKIRPYILKYFTSKFAVCLFFYKVTNLKSEWIVNSILRGHFPSTRKTDFKYTANLRCWASFFLNLHSLSFSGLHFTLQGSRQLTQTLNLKKREDRPNLKLKPKKESFRNSCNCSS